MGSQESLECKNFQLNSKQTAVIHLHSLLSREYCTEEKTVITGKHILTFRHKNDMKASFVLLVAVVAP